MNESIGSRLKHAWNVFRARDETEVYDWSYMGNSTVYQNRPRLSSGNERSIVTSVYNRIAMDVAAYDFRHVRLDQNGRFLENVDSSLNNCLTVEANIDQQARAFIQDAVLSMFDEGVVALVPIDTTFSPIETGGYDIRSMRTGRIIDWFPKHVRVDVYNDSTGRREQIIMPKNIVCIIENPLYIVMNEPNSTMRRLIRKLNLLDVIDEQSGSGKLDLIIQLPYVIKSEARQKQAEERRKMIEQQLAGGKYGIAYTDGTEHITQLNRPAENNLMAQITYLQGMLYNQLGLTENVFNGTADQQTMLNYYNRTVEVIVTAFVDEMKRKCLTKTARTQNQTIMGFRDIFRLVPANELAEIADKFTRNEILSSNEVRSIIGVPPSDQPSADELRNKNMPIRDGMTSLDRPQN